MRTGLARGISIVGHPFATMFLLASIAAFQMDMRIEPILVAGGVVLPLAAFIVQRRRSGRWRTVDASDPHDRPALYIVAGSLTAAVLVVLLLSGDRIVARWIGGVMLIFGVAALANRWLKTSLHMAFAVFAAVSLQSLGSRAGWGVLAMLPLLAWSRRHLQRHTTPEIVAGTLLGSVAALLVVALR